MSRANRAQLQRRVQEVLKLLLAGAEHLEIVQYARDQGWGVCERQIQRYQRQAYKQLAKLQHKNKEELQGRHLLQRRGLYARALRNGDLKTALLVLKDEAELAGLYPPTKVAPTTPDGESPYQPQPAQPEVPRQKRLIQWVTAQAQQDRRELNRLKETAPLEHYELPDTLLPLLGLQLIAQQHVLSQLEFAARWQSAQRRRTPESLQLWSALETVCAYRFQLGQAAWLLLTGRLGISPDLLLNQVPGADSLPVLAQVIPYPGAEEVQQALAQCEEQIEEFPTAAILARNWKRWVRPLIES